MPSAPQRLAQRLPVHGPWRIAAVQLFHFLRFRGDASNHFTQLVARGRQSLFLRRVERLSTMATRSRLHVLQRLIGVFGSLADTTVSVFSAVNS